MELENLNLVELSPQDLKQTEGGFCINFFGILEYCSGFGWDWLLW
jgi:hypothetical protein